MKILHLLNSNQFSGAENVVCQIVNMFREDSDIEMVYVSPDGQIRKALYERNVRFVSIIKMSVQEVRRIIHEEKPDIIYAHDMRASFYAARACGKIPLVSHIHNNAFDARGISPKSIAYMYAAKKAKHILWVSKSSYDGYAFHELLKKKSTVLYNIIDMDALYKKMRLDTNEYDYDVVYLGRLTFPKNPKRLMQVFSLIKEQLPTVKIAVIGTGELEEETKAFAKECDLLDNVSFLGFQSNPLKILHDSKVMVMTSHWEGTPMCALEAMTLGVPIVSTPTDGMRDLIDHGVTGFLSDKDATLAEYIASLIQDEQLYREMSKKTLEKAKRVNNKVMYKAEIRRILYDII